MATILSAQENISCENYIKRPMDPGNEVNTNLILSPATLSATMASISHASLILDPNEMSLVSVPMNMTGAVTVAIDEKHIVYERSKDKSVIRSSHGESIVSIEAVALACLAIAIDAAIHSSMKGEEDKSVR